MEFVLILFGIICTVIGVIGCIFPAIPGPPLSYAALILLQLAKEEPVFSKSFLIRFAVLTIVVSLIDYFLPLLGAKLYGTTKYGIWGAIIGMIAGIIFFPPFGMILGIFIGAIVGELIAGKENSMALKAGLVTFIGSITAVFIKLSLSLVMAFYFFILETERLKLIPLDDYTFPFYRVLEKVGMEKYEENETMFWWKLIKI